MVAILAAALIGVIIYCVVSDIVAEKKRVLGTPAFGNPDKTVDPKKARKEMKSKLSFIETGKSQ